MSSLISLYLIIELFHSFDFIFVVHIYSFRTVFQSVIFGTKLSRNFKTELYFLSTDRFILRLPKTIIQWISRINIRVEQRNYFVPRRWQGFKSRGI